jgi:glycosyltransferase domain-containing protein
VCILSLERPENLRKQIHYYSNIRVNVVILDASVNRARLNYEPNIEYHHIPNSTFHFRLNYLSQIVKTNYLVLQADDDFHGIEGLGSCLEFLKENNDFSCAQGRYLRFFSKETRAWISDYDFQNSLSILSDNAESRVNQYFNSGMHFIYSVMPTLVFTQVVQLLKKIEIGDLIMNELVFSFSLGCFGKYKTLPVFYSVRGMDLRPDYIESSTLESWKLSKNGNEFEIFQDSISKFYMQKLKCNRDRGEMITKELIANYDLRIALGKMANEIRILAPHSKSELIIYKVNSFLKKSSWFRSLIKYRRRSIWRFFWDITSVFNLLKFTRDFSRIRKSINKA